MKKLHILVVDDDRDFAEGVADALELEGHNVTLAGDGVEALERYTEAEFDLVFMDVKLPGRNGVESFLEIRRRFPGARAIMMTAYSTENLLDQAAEKGVMGILDKPLAFDPILALLERVQAGGRVLVVDDDVDFARELRDVLEVAGYTVRSCFDGATALQKCTEESFSAVVLDLRLPDTSGLDLHRKIRELRPDALVIPVTGYPEEEHAAAHLDKVVSVKNVLRKPFHPEQLLALLEEN